MPLGSLPGSSTPLVGGRVPSTGGATLVAEGWREADDRGMRPTAFAHEGVFSAAFATSVGLGGTALRRLVKAGEAHPLHRGWYPIWKPTDPRDLLRLRTRALLQEYGEDAVASHSSAVVLLDLPTESVDFSLPHLMWRGEQFFHAFGRFRAHERVVHPDLPVQGQTVHPALACVQVGLHDPRALIVAADAALRQELVTAEQLSAACDALKGHRGLTRVRATLPWCDERHESSGEPLTAFVLRMLGYDLEPQFAPGTAGPRGGEEHVDFLIKGTKVIIEFDGAIKYQADSAEEAQQLLFLEKQREDRIRDLGYEVVRLTMSDLSKPERVRAKIEAALERGRTRHSA